MQIPTSTIQRTQYEGFSPRGFSRSNSITEVARSLVVSAVLWTVVGFALYTVYTWILTAK